MDGRYLLGGWVSNILEVVALILGPVIVVLFVPITVSGVFTVAGFLKKGSVNRATAKVLLLGNFPIWLLGIWSFPVAVDSYQRSLSLCQDHITGYLASSYECSILLESFYSIWLLIASVAVALTISFASLLSLTGLSSKSWHWKKEQPEEELD